MLTFDDTKQNPEDEIFMIDARKLRVDRLGRNTWRQWVEDAFIDFSVEELNKSGKNYMGLALSRRRLTIFLAIILISLGALFFRAGQLQIIKGGHYGALAERNRIRVQYLAAPRGIIYDSKMRSLLKNIPDFSLYIIPYDLPKKQAERKEIEAGLQATMVDWQSKYAARFAEILNTPTFKKDYFEPQILATDLDYQTTMKLKIFAQSVSGVDVKINGQREYLDPAYGGASSLSHILGYEGPISQKEFDVFQYKGYLLNDRIGKTGLELFYENDLRGESGKREVEVDSAGKEKSIIAEDKIVKGNDLILSLDFDAQKKLEQIVRAQLLRINKQRAVAIAMNPNNGEIVAMVSEPTFNNNLFASGISAQDYQKLIDNPNQPLFNRAVSGEYPSGSVIKPVIAAAALQEGIINENTSFLSVGGLTIDKWFFPDWKTGGHGITNVTKALADSVNTFFYIIGGGWQKFVGLGVYKIKQYSELFGLNQKLGIDLPDEGTGFLPTAGWKESAKGERWFIGDTYHLAIGQGDLLVTPLQVASYTTVIANGGTLYKPHLVKTISNEQTGLLKNIEPEIIRQNFISKKNIDIVRSGMRQAVTYGSAKHLNSLPMAVAGKTGTAQWDMTKKPHAWFTGFAPYNNPQIVITVLIEEGGEGSIVSVPIAQEFLYWWQYNKK
ncbi:penicillin-binding protein 2 [Candidatus Falkowbacteria bacterium]|nr:penicillin-binding protein 2 [Candidatus Falkowbacteria bacterium]